MDPVDQAPPADDALRIAPQPRVLEMAALRGQGFSLRQIAARFTVSRERVRQILLAHGGPDRHDAREARRRRAERLAEAKVDELLRLWRAGESPAGIALQYGLDLPACRGVIERNATDADRYARQAKKAEGRAVQMYSDEEIIRGLQAAATIFGHVPTAREYAAFASETDLPSLATVSNRMHGWSSAVAAAGLLPDAGNVRSHPRRWTQDACWEALGRAVADLGEIPTVLAYDRFATGRGDLPSSATIRKRLGRWSSVAAKLAAQAGPADDEVGPRL